jgi:thiamine pyrophosphate-dependent acetolactate synthase large subunit-like protein
MSRTQFSQWPRMMAASSTELAWVTVSDVIAQTVWGDHFFFRSSLRRRMIWMTWAACGNASPAATALTFRARRSGRPFRQ